MRSRSTPVAAISRTDSGLPAPARISYATSAGGGKRRVRRSSSSRRRGRASVRAGLRPSSRDGHRVPLTVAVRELALGRGLDEPLEPGRVLVDAPLDEREGALLDRDDLALRVRQTAVRRELASHRIVGDLADVIEQVLPDGDLGQLLEMERFSLAPQHLDGGFGERHALPSIEGSAIFVPPPLRCQR